MVCRENQVIDLSGVFLKDGQQKGSKIIVKSSGKWCVVRKLWEFPVDCPYHLDIVVPDKLEVFLLVLFCRGGDRQQEILMQSALLVLLPIAEPEMVLASVAEQPHHFQQKLEQR